MDVSVATAIAQRRWAYDKLAEGSRCHCAAPLHVSAANLRQTSAYSRQIVRDAPCATHSAPTVDFGDGEVLAYIKSTWSERARKYQEARSLADPMP